MTISGSKLTRSVTERTLICDAILYHFQITFLCGHINRHIIPLTLFLLSYPLEQLEFIRSSNFRAENSFVPVTRPQPSILPRYFQSRYRRHLAHFKRIFHIIRARRSFTKALVSLFTPYKNLRSVPFNLGRMCVKHTSSHFTITSHKESL